jgi:methionyl-tRNA formyltransferase
MRMDAGVDTGPILCQREESILPEDHAETLARRLAQLGADLLVETLPRYLSGELQPKPQDETGITRAGMIRKDDGQLDFNQPAQGLAWKVRAFQPWPGTIFIWAGNPLKVLRAHAVPQGGGLPGEKQVYQNFPAVATSVGWLVLDEVQPSGKKAMPGDVFLRGARQWLEKGLT